MDTVVYMVVAGLGLLVAVLAVVFSILAYSRAERCYIDHVAFPKALIAQVEEITARFDTFMDVTWKDHTRRDGASAKKARSETPPPVAVDPLTALRQTAIAARLKES